MKETFQFWGYSPDTFAQMVGEGRPMQSAQSGSLQPVLGRVELGDELIARCGPLQDRCASGWWAWLLLDPEVPVVGEALAWLWTSKGGRQAIVTRTTDNAFRFWFDLDATVTFIQNEKYLVDTPPVYLKLGVNPARIPERLRKLAFRAMHHVRGLRRKKKHLFPSRSADPAVESWRYVVRSIVEDCIAGRGMPLWPEGKQYAVTLSHDIDSDYCFRNPQILELFHTIENEAGMRSAWMVVTKLLPAGRAALSELRRDGHEIGFHGSHHDHKLAYLPPEEMAKRIQCALELIEGYATTGVRSPSYLRSTALYAALDGVFEYDMSMHDAIFAPTALSTIHEGCSTTMPFLIEGTNLLEIPVTIPEDWTFDLEGVSLKGAREVQREAVARIKARGGVASILTHPEPHYSIKPHWLELYRYLLSYVAADPDAWVALPCEINRHWRSRQATIAALWEQRPGCRSTSARTRGSAPVDNCHPVVR